MSNSSVSGFVNPDVVAAEFHLEPGDRVADFGAGTGYFLKALSDAVGRDGRVYACEIQKNLVAKMELLIKEAKLSNTQTLWVDIETPGGIKIKDCCLDAGILVNTLFQLENKDTALLEISRSLNKGGMLYIIDWTDSFAGLGPHALHVVTENDAISLAEKAGFTLERKFPAGEHHYGLALRRV